MWAENSYKEIIRTVKRTIIILLYSLVALYLGVVTMLNIPYFQRKMTVIVTQQLEEFLDTKLTIGRIDIGLMNRIIIDRLEVKDQRNKPLLGIPRFSASFEWLPLFQGKISIRSVQLYGVHVALYKRSEKEALNCQFLIDAFSSKEPSEKSLLDFRINSLLIRQGSLSYDLFSKPRVPEKFDASHVKITDLSATLSLKHYSSDSLNFSLKRMSFKEQSGFVLSRLKFFLIANRDEASVNRFEIRLPHSAVALSDVRATYKGLENSEQLGDSLFFSFGVLPSTVLLSDLAPFAPVLAKFTSPLHTEMLVDGKMNYLNVRDIHFYSSYNSAKAVDLRGDLHLRDLLRESDSYIAASLRNATLSAEEINQLSRNLVQHGVKVPPILGRIGSLSARADLRGYSGDLTAECALLSESGEVNSVLRCRRQQDEYRISFDLTGENLDLKRLLDTDELGKTSLTAQTEMIVRKDRFTSLQTKGTIQSLEYLKYNYQNIVFDGTYDHRGFDGLISLHDPNGRVDINGRFDLEEKIKEYHLSAKVQGFNPHNLNLTKEYEGSEFSFLLDLDFKGNKLNDMLGTINMDSTDIRLPDKRYLVSHMDLHAYHENGIRKVFFNSPFAEADIQGRFDYTTLPVSLLNMLKQYTPSLLSQTGHVTPKNDFKFSVQLHETGVLTDLFTLPFTIHDNSTFHGFIDDDTHTMRLQGDFPDLSYGNARLKDISLYCTNTPESFDCNVSGNALMKDGSLLNMALLAKAQDDQVQASFEWDNKAEIEYKGKMSASAFLRKSPYSKHLLADITILPTEVILEDSVWNVEKAVIQIDSSRINISGFCLKHGQQQLKVSGSLSKEEHDFLTADLQNIRLGYVFDVINFHPVEFEGSATGTATAYQVLSSPRINASLRVKDFLFNEALLGDLDITGGFDAENDAITLNASMKEEGLSATRVVGAVHPKRKDLDLEINAEGTNLAFIQPYVESIISGVNGRAHGDFRLFGGFKSLAIEGKGKADASFHVDVLGVSYHLNDSVVSFPDRFIFNKAHITDREGHNGVVDGMLRHNHFKDFTYSLQIQSDDMMILNKRETFDLPFYGKVYARGNATLTGNTQRLDVSAGMTTSDQTEFCYKLTSATTASNSAFVQFASHRDSEGDSLSGNSMIYPSVPENEAMDVRLNLLIDVTPQATMKVIVDPRAGDYMSCTGIGSIRMDFFNKGDLRMFGTYTVSQGIYKFSLQEVIRKEFTIRSGSFVSFNGDPYRANCNLNTSYTVNAVSLRDLGNDVISVLPNTQTSVRVNCLMDVTGMISSPEISLGLELPNENEEVQRVVRNFISTDDQMNMQILYLLGIGKFYTPDYANKTGQNSDAMSAVLSSTLSGQLNNMLSQMINSNKWNFGVNGTTGEEGWTDMEFQGMLSGQLLNNRLLINGNFGYRDNSMVNSNQQSNFIGDFDIEYLLTKTGDVRLKAYNKSNDRYSTKTNLNTQGIGVLYKKDFNSWWDFLPWRNKKKNKK